MKKLIFNADHFGENNNYNRAVLNGCNSGFLRSASIIANGEAYDAAINEILPECPKLSLGIDLNLTRGKALTKCTNLVDNENYFNKNLFSIIKLCEDVKILREIENELRAQIDKVSQNTKLTHIDSVDNIHAIPEIFSIVCKLAKEYDVAHVITHSQKYNAAPNVRTLVRPSFWINAYTCVLLYSFNVKNKNTLSEYNLKTNNYIISSLYYGMLDKNLLRLLLSAYFEEKEAEVYVKLEPCSYLRNINDNHSKEFKLTQDKLLEDDINRMGFDISNYR